MKNGQEVWEYQPDGQHKWYGIAVYAILSLPLAFPVGPERYLFYFDGDNLDRAESKTTRTSAFVCDPLYHILSGFALTPTGKPVDQPVCDVESDHGFYFHP